MSAPTTHPYTPRNFIAGQVKAVRGKELQAAAAAASAVLGTESIAIIHSISQGSVWYLAATAADLASHPGASSTLSAALPGTKNHQGDGAYVCDLAAGMQAVVLKQGEHVQSFVGAAAMVKRFVRLEGAKVGHTCTDEGLLWQLPAEPAKLRAWRLNLALTVSGLLLALGSSGVWLWAAHGVSQQTALRDALRQEHVKAWSTAVAGLEPAAYPKALADLQKAIAQAKQEKAVLLKFEHQNGRSSWSMSVNGRVLTGASN